MPPYHRSWASQLPVAQGSRTPNVDLGPRHPLAMPLTSWYDRAALSNRERLAIHTRLEAQTRVGGTITHPSLHGSPSGARTGCRLCGPPQGGKTKHNGRCLFHHAAVRRTFTDHPRFDRRCTSRQAIEAAGHPISRSSPPYRTWNRSCAIFPWRSLFDGRWSPDCTAGGCISHGRVSTEGAGLTGRFDLPAPLAAEPPPAGPLQRDP
jgi:hypothetical protein